MEKIGDRIQRRRKELNMSQDDLARKLGYRSRSSINKIERDASGLPQTKIAAIAKALDTTPSFIMGWQDAIEESPVETAKQYAEIIKDADFMELYLEYKKLNAEEKKMIKKIIRNMANDND